MRVIAYWYSKTVARSLQVCFADMVSLHAQEPDSEGLHLAHGAEILGPGAAHIDPLEHCSARDLRPVRLPWSVDCVSAYLHALFLRETDEHEWMALSQASLAAYPAIRLGLRVMRCDVVTWDHTSGYRPDTARRDSLDYISKGFSLLFTLEFVVKVLAKGLIFCHNGYSARCDALRGL